MAICYQKLFPILEKKGWTTYKIRKEKLIGQGTLTALKNSTGGLDSKTISRLCEVLDCQPGDFMEYIPDAKKQKPSSLPPHSSSTTNHNSSAPEATSLFTTVNEQPPSAPLETLGEQKKYYKHLSEAKANQINLQELSNNIKYQIDIADIYGMNVLSSLLEKARQQTEENNQSDA